MPAQARKPESPHALEAVMAELEAAGTEQTRKTLVRHSVTGPAFGVSYAILYKIQKRIKKDHTLALELWKTGNHDARILATLIADPGLAAKTVPTWMNDLDCYAMSGALAAYAGKSPDAKAIAVGWKDDSSEWKATVAWHTFGVFLTSNQTTLLPDSYFEALLAQIEREIHDRPNWVRYSMIGVLIGIGSVNEHLKAKALEAAKRIGDVHVDHGDTASKTPDPFTMIEKAYAHRHRKT